MNVYEKLQKVKFELSQIQFKKSGKNDYAKYDYFELGDFLPHIIKLCTEVKLCTFVDFEKEHVCLNIVDIEKPEDFISIQSPMSTASLKGCHDVQNLGAVQTYLRRYLYMAAFDIVDTDIVNKSIKQEQLPKPLSEMTIAQLRWVIKEPSLLNFHEEAEECLKNLIAQNANKTRIDVKDKFDDVADLEK